MTGSRELSVHSTEGELLNVLQEFWRLTQVDHSAASRYLRTTAPGMDRGTRMLLVRLSMGADPFDATRHVDTPKDFPAFLQSVREAQAIVRRTSDELEVLIKQLPQDDF